MRVVKCEKNLHWYDADAYEKCPHCNPSIGKILTTDSRSNRGSQTSSGSDSSPAVAKKKSQDQEIADGRFIDITGGVIGSRGAEKKKGIDGTLSAFDSDDSAATTPDSSEDLESPSSSSSVPSEFTTPSDIRKELQGVSNSSVERTLSYFGKASQARSPAENTVDNSSSVQSAPVVGWLVCIAGPHIGQSFNILAGKNSIGRANDNDIVLSSDPGVSGHRHAWITYESKHRNFILKAGDGRYPDLNGEQVIESKLLKLYDKIEIGETVLLFINLCGDNFDWEDYFNGEK